MDSSLVSIIIPCFNGESFVAEAIQSALAQTYSNKEIVVVDDGSGDGSLSIIQSFGDRIRFATGPNRGGSAARNQGLTMATGGLIQFLDADDVLDRDKLELQVPLMQNGDATMVYSDWRQSEPDHPGQFTRFRVVPSSDDPVVIALDSQNIQTNASLHRRATLTAVGGFREGLPCCQERDLILRLACIGARFQYFPKVLHTVRRRANSVASDERKILRWMGTLISERYAELKSAGKLTPVRSRAFAALLARQGRVLFRYGERERAREYFEKAVRMDPTGLADAYKPAAYLLYQSCGPETAETILGWWKRLVIVSGLHRRRLSVDLGRIPPD